MPALRSAVTPHTAKVELAKRRLAQRHLLPFSTYMAPWYQPVAHHRLVAEYLEKVALYISTGGKEGIGRLMIFEPPRYGKTVQVSQLFPAWLLGNQPDVSIILASYGLDLAVEDSVAVRDYVLDGRFSSIFGRKSAVTEIPVEMREDSRSKNRWKLAIPHRGGVLAAGVGGRITGFGAHLLNINDPFKGREEAESAAYRRKVSTWYRGNAYTRLEDGGAIIITHTRWDPEDLAGQMLMRMVSDDPDADQWTVVFLPEIALEKKVYPKTQEEFRENLMRGTFLPMGGDMLGRKPGELLWGEKFHQKAVDRKHANMGDFEWTAQCQQLPRLSEGEFFDEKDFHIAEKVPDGLLWFRYCDLALGESQRADWNTSAAVAFDARGNLYIRDMLHVHELDDFLDDVLELMLSDLEKGTIWGFESVSFQKLIVKQFLAKKILANIPIEAVMPDGDKVSRARPWRMRAKQGKVFLVRGTWNLTFIREVTSFPKGRHDDQVDTVSGGIQMIADHEGGDDKAATAQAEVTEAVEMFS